MPAGGGSDPPGGTAEKRKLPSTKSGGNGTSASEDFYKPYIKPGYKRLFAESAVSGEFSVYVESTKENEKLGNNNPIVTTNLFKNEIKGITNIKRVNANKIAIAFTQANNANNFLRNENFLTKHKLKAYIPASAVETIGVLRFVPTSISNEELFKKLSSPYEIICVRRFTKKVNGDIKPFQTVSITFLSKYLPDYVYLDLYRFHVHEYNAPLLQCFKCFKFNHGAKICKQTQKCSICAEEHHFSQCTSGNVAKCINCQGPHLAISRDCPVKKAKMEERKYKSYANVVSKANTSTTRGTLKNYQTDYPSLPMKNKNSIAPQKTQVSSVTLSTASVATSTGDNLESTTQNDKSSNEKIIDEILNNEYIRKGLIGALVAIGNDGRPLTNNVIQEILIKSLKGSIH